MKNNPTSKEINIDDFFKDPMFISKTIQAGMNKELLKHKQAGNPVCTWRNGKVVWIAPEELKINLYDEPDENLNREQNKLEGKKEFLVMLLNSKFGQVPDIYLVRIHDATASEIEHFSNKILNANSMDEIFN